TESPHAHLDRSPWGLADRTWLEAQARQYGADSQWYRTHVLAEIPTIAEDALIPEPWLDAAAGRGRPIAPPGHPVLRSRRLACDLGEGVGRDSSCVLVRDDWGILDVTFGSALGLPEAASVIARKAWEHTVPPDRITYDRLGIGKDFAVHLARHGI